MFYAFTQQLKGRKWHPYQIALFLFLVFLVYFRIRNVLAFNPYWGYDGGGHVDYILSLAKHHTFPSIETNDVAWHEPLYYFIYAAIAKVTLLFTEEIRPILKVLGLTQAALSLATSYVMYRLITLVTKSRAVVFSSFVVLNLLSPMIQASTFVTNELLNYFFILLITVLTIRIIHAERVDGRSALVLGVVGGLALLTKITAIIPLFFMGLVVLWYLRPLTRKTKFRVALAFILPMILMQLPWQMYRQSDLFTHPTINNPHLLEPAPLVLDERLHFYTWFDTEIFTFPYWYSGGRSFWSMLYADSVYDYYGMMENRDWIAQAGEEDLIFTSSRESFVSVDNRDRSGALVWLGIIPIFIMILGIVQMCIRPKGRERVLGVLGIGFTGAFLAALLFFSYRYPHYDMGIVKSIFIYPVYIFPVIYGFHALHGMIRSTYWNWLPVLLISPYLLFLVPAFWVRSFGY